MGRRGPLSAEGNPPATSTKHHQLSARRRAADQRPLLSHTARTTAACCGNPPSPQGVFPFLHRAKAKIPTTLRSPLLISKPLTSPPQAQDHAPRSFSSMCMLCLLCNTAIKSLHDHHPSLGLSNPPEHKILTDGGTGHTRSAVIGGESKGLKGGTPKRGVAVRQDGRSSEHARLYMPGLSPLLPGFSNRLSRIFTAPIISSRRLRHAKQALILALLLLLLLLSAQACSLNFPPDAQALVEGETPQVRCPRCGSEAVSR
jgi:hypothetical protein